MTKHVDLLSVKYALSFDLAMDFYKRVIDLNNIDKGMRMLKSGRFPYEIVTGGINISLWRHIIAIELWNKRRNNLKASISMFSVVMLALKEIKIDQHNKVKDRSRRGRNWQPLIEVMETAIRLELNEN